MLCAESEYISSIVLVCKKITTTSECAFIILHIISRTNITWIFTDDLEYVDDCKQ